MNELRGLIDVAYGQLATAQTTAQEEGQPSLSFDQATKLEKAICLCEELLEELLEELEPETEIKKPSIGEYSIGYSIFKKLTPSPANRGGL